MSLLESAHHLIDDRFGPILHVRRQFLGQAEPSWWLATTQLGRHPIGNPFSEDQAAGAGTSIDLAEAMNRAIGESLERYSALTWSPPITRATLREGGLHDRWPRCAREERAPESLKSPPPDVPIQCVTTRHVVSGAEMFVPAAHVLLQHQRPATEPVLALSISTGLAFSQHQPSAIWNALCEIIERDAVMSTWWIADARPEIDVVHAPQRVAERISRLAAKNMTARLFDITTEISIPTVLCTLASETYPHLVVGAATKASAVDACTKALDEVVSMRVALSAHSQSDPLRKRHNRTPGSPSTLIDHALLYAERPTHPAFDFLDQGDRLSFATFQNRSIPQPTDWASLRDHVAGLEATGLTILWADVTTDDVAPLGTVARVVVPELVPLSPRDDIRWLATTRLADRSERSSSPGRYSPYPHPFA